MRRIIILISTFFYSGYFPFASGTAGTIVFLPFYWFIFGRMSWPFYVLSAVIITLAGIWASNYAAVIFGKKDPGKVVIDEVAGYMVTMFLIPLSFVNMIMGFFLSRIFDIIKPPPARQFEKLHGGTGIMMDDIMAGVYANITMHILLHFKVDAFIEGIISGFLK
ncbi:MAG TPA: phosphatidylglycerophosphatase A [bacterium]|nr:phosphatidylglycerophosphatase A [bacterium]